MYLLRAEGARLENECKGNINFSLRFAFFPGWMISLNLWTIDEQFIS